MSILLSIVNAALGGVFSTVKDVVHDLATQKISEAEAKAKIAAAEAEARTKTEQAWADAEARTYDSFTKMAAQSIVLQRAITVMIVVELLVLVFYQIGVPFLAFAGYAWPKPGIELEWAYLLLLGCTGLGALVTRTAK